MRRLVKNTTKYITMLIFVTMVLMFSGCGKTEDDAEKDIVKAMSIIKMVNRSDVHSGMQR